MKLVLASASPRRRALLTEAGYHFDVVSAAAEEVAPPHLTTGEITLFNARLKALAVAALRPNDVILAADTLVAIHGRILGKPVDWDESREMLRLLSGNTHQVFTGVWVQTPEHAATLVEVTQVTFRALSTAEIEDYMRVIGPLDKAGAYAAQETHLDIISKIEGSLTNVIGLPMEGLSLLPELDFARQS